MLRQGHAADEQDLTSVPSQNDWGIKDWKREGKGCMTDGGGVAGLC